MITASNVLSAITLSSSGKTGTLKFKTFIIDQLYKISQMSHHGGKISTCRQSFSACLCTGQLPVLQQDFQLLI
jgi:hypothetical protein